MSLDAIPSDNAEAGESAAGGRRRPLVGQRGPCKELGSRARAQGRWRARMPAGQTPGRGRRAKAGAPPWRRRSGRPSAAGARLRVCLQGIRWDGAGAVLPYRRTAL